MSKKAPVKRAPVKKATAKKEEVKTKRPLPKPIKWKYFKIEEKSFIAIPYNTYGTYPFPDREKAKQFPDVDRFRILDVSGNLYLRTDQSKQVTSWRTTKEFAEAYLEGNIRVGSRYKLIPCESSVDKLFPG
jgi:hypothetical protein